MEGLTHTIETGVRGERLVVFRINGAHYVTYAVTEKGWTQADLTCNWQIQPTREMELEIRRITNEQVQLVRSGGPAPVPVIEPIISLNVDPITLMLARQEVSDRIRHLTSENEDGQNRARLSELGVLLTQINLQLSALKQNAFDLTVEAMRSAQSIARFRRQAGA